MEQLIELPLYYKIADAMKQAADELRIPIEWGGDWRTFKDGPHFQLPGLNTQKTKRRGLNEHLECPYRIGQTRHRRD